MDMKYSFEEIG